MIFPLDNLKSALGLDDFPTIQIKFKEVDELSDSSRGEGGFGSTGV